MNAILARAASLITPDSYSRKHAVATLDGESFSTDRKASVFSITGAIEHAAALRVSGGGQSVFLRAGNGGEIAHAKAELCRRLGCIHLDAWEYDTKPDAAAVKQALLSA